MNTYSIQWMQRGFGRLGGLIFVLALVLQAGLTPAAGAISPGAPVPAGLTAQEWRAAQQALPPSAQAYLKASNTGEDDTFGGAVALSGNTLVVGAYGEASVATGVNGDQTNNSAPYAGAAYVLVRTGTTWSQQAYLKASNTEDSDVFGVAVAIDDDTIVIGAPLEASIATGVNGNQADNSAPFAGAAYVFVRTGATWTQQAYLKASNTANDNGTGIADIFGTSVAVSGDTIVVGALIEASAATGVNGDQQDNSAPYAGAAYVFVRSSPAGTPTWSQQAYLKASNTDAGDNFGTSVALDGDTIVVGAPGEDSAARGINSDQTDNSAQSAGAVYVFVRSSPGGTPTWSQQAYLKASNTEVEDGFGHLVAIDGDTVVVAAGSEDSGATGVNGDQADNSAPYAGAAYVFVRTGAPEAPAWSQQAYLKASNTEQLDVFGASIAISADTIVVGALYEKSAATGVNGDQNDNSLEWAGAAYVFERSDMQGTPTWSQQAYLKAFNTGWHDLYSTSVAVDGDTFAIGAPGEASAATGVNGNQQDNTVPHSGAVYVYGPAFHTIYVPLVLK